MHESRERQVLESLSSTYMLLGGPRVLLCVTALVLPAGWRPLGAHAQRGDDVTEETFTDDPMLADVVPPTDDLGTSSAGGHPGVTIVGTLVLQWVDSFDMAQPRQSSECRDEKFACTRLYSVQRPVKQCLHTNCFTSLRRMYIINSEICSRLVCKEHDAMKDELCRQMAGLPPRRLRRSGYFRLPPCGDANPQRPNGV
ncbi:microfibrillar-associated protein 5 [Ctenodactylus gundi]